MQKLISDYALVIATEGEGASLRYVVKEKSMPVYDRDNKEALRDVLYTPEQLGSWKKSNEMSIWEQRYRELDEAVRGAECSVFTGVAAKGWLYEQGRDGLTAVLGKGATNADAARHYEAHKLRLGLPPSFSGWDGVRR